ncbi:unnamed protein product [Diplocarpon coronariae]
MLERLQAHLGVNPWPFILGGALLVALYQFLQTLRIAYRSDLAPLPGPRWAKFTGLYRVFRLWRGDAPDFYMEIHRKYGNIVRTGPNTVSIADPAAIPVLYGIGSSFIKAEFYETFTPFYKDARMESLFSTRDPAYHKAIKRPVANKFSMSSLRLLESLIDICSAIFVATMRDIELENESKTSNRGVDLGEWLQWYAFDVIGMITFHRRFGFMEQRKDVRDMIAGLETTQKYCALVGQVDGLHPWLAGNQKLMRALEAIPGLNVPNPLRTFVQVSTHLAEKARPHLIGPALILNPWQQITQQCIDEYDSSAVRADEKKTTPDFLTFLRLEGAKTGESLSHRDMVNHLSNNIFAGSDTTAISLRAILYYILKTPQSYSRLQKEIDGAQRAGRLSEFITYSESLELEYLQVVMKEAMRCHPGVAYPLERLVPKGNIDLCGRCLREGTNVGINPWVIHRNTEVFGADAAVFRPERWLEASAEQLKIMERSLLTSRLEPSAPVKRGAGFGYGARSCIGKNISIMEMGKFVPQILRQFEMHWASDAPEWTVKTYWFSKQSDLMVRLKTRDRAAVDGM